MKELNYLIVDMNSLYHQIQFKYVEQFNKFYLLLDSIIHSYYDNNHIQQKEIWFVSTVNSDQYRKKQFQLLGINDYQIEDVFEDNNHYIDFQYKMKKELDKMNLSKAAKKDKILEKMNDIRNELLTGKLKINNAKLKN